MNQENKSPRREFPVTFITGGAQGAQGALVPQLISPQGEVGGMGAKAVDARAEPRMVEGL